METVESVISRSSCMCLIYAQITMLPQRLVLIDHMAIDTLEFTA